MGTFISPFSPFCSLARWREGLGGQRRGAELCSGGWKQARAASRGNELPEHFTWGGGGVLLAWLLPISFTSGWAVALALPLESLARHRGVGWKSPSGWESHKCVNKCNDQSLLLCPGNTGLSWMAGGDCQAASYSCLRTGASGKKKIWKKLFPRKTRVRCHATAIYVSSEQCND